MKTPYLNNELDLEQVRNTSSYNRYRQNVREDERQATWYEDLMITLAWCAIGAAIYAILTGGI